MVPTLAQYRIKPFKPLKGLLDLQAKGHVHTPSLLKTNGKRFVYALQSRWTQDISYSLHCKGGAKGALKDSLNNSQNKYISSTDDSDFASVAESSISTILHPREYRKRDSGSVKLPNHIRRKTSPKKPNGDFLRRLKSLTLNIRCLKVGALTKTFRTSESLACCTFTTDYIEIGYDAKLCLPTPGFVQGRIQASDIVSCELCVAQELPALFLQTTPEAFLGLLAKGDGVKEQYRRANQLENCVVFLFVAMLTHPEQIELEEILMEIGNQKNNSCFVVKLKFDEANTRLNAHSFSQERDLVCSRSFSNSPQYETPTLSVSDSDEATPKDDFKTLIVYPPPPAKGGLTITEEDFNCLKENQFLNDVIVDFYLRYLVCEQQKTDSGSKFHVFSSFFFKHLTQENNKPLSGMSSLSNQERRHNRVKRWTRNVNLFDKDFIFVPINQRAHWYLAVICFPGEVSQPSGSDHLNGRMHSEEQYLTIPSPPNPMSLFFSPEPSKQLSRWSQSIDDLNKSFYLFSDDESEEAVEVVVDRFIHSKDSDFSKRPCIIIMDSLSYGGRSSVVKILQEYLEEEWKVRMGSELSFKRMKGWSASVPQQCNYSDCGIYLLQYVESFIKDPPKTFHEEMDLKDWFSQKMMTKKRRQVKKLILRLHLQQQV